MPEHVFCNGGESVATREEVIRYTSGAYETCVSHLLYKLRKTFKKYNIPVFNKIQFMLLHSGKYPGDTYHSVSRPRGRHSRPGSHSTTTLKCISRCHIGIDAGWKRCSLIKTSPTLMHFRQNILIHLAFRETNIFYQSY